MHMRSAVTALSSELVDEQMTRLGRSQQILKLVERSLGPTAAVLVIGIAIVKCGPNNSSLGAAGTTAKQDGTDVCTTRAREAWREEAEPMRAPPV